MDGDGNILVADSDRIQKFSNQGTFLGEWGTHGSADGQFFDATDIAVGPSGIIYVTDRGNMRVQAFDASGTFLFKWGSFGSGDGNFHQPTSLTVDTHSNIYVAEIYGYRIQKFSAPVAVQELPWADVKGLYR